MNLAMTVSLLALLGIACFLASAYLQRRLRKLREAKPISVSGTVFRPANHVEDSRPVAVCRKCSRLNADYAVFCASCGFSMEEPVRFTKTLHDQRYYDTALLARTPRVNSEPFEGLPPGTVLFDGATCRRNITTKGLPAWDVNLRFQYGHHSVEVPREDLNRLIPESASVTSFPDTSSTPR